MTGEERIAAPRDVVWAALNDPEIIKQCIPRCESFERISPTLFVAVFKVRVGPLSASFNGEVTLSNVNGPESYTISGEGKGGIAGFAKGGADVVLTPDDGETVLQYEARGEIGGRIAQLGSRLIASSAKKLAQQFFSDFNAVVSIKTEA
jgi:carbon monoxide dehydrogenase subunit G